MKLTLGERAMLGEMLPKQGDWSTLTYIRNIQQAIVPTEQDIKDAGGEIHADGKITYSLSLDKGKEKTFDDMELKVIRDTLEGLEKSKTLPGKGMTLYEKFVLKK